MKKTQAIELLANIRVTFVSFFSILMFVALGVSVFLGLQWGGMALGTAFDEELNTGGFHDIEIQLPVGITDQSLDAIRATEGVQDAEGIYVSYQQAKVGKRNEVFKVQSIPQRLDRPQVVEGDLPQKSGQIAVLETWARDHGVEVGDTITFDKDGPTDDVPMLYLQDDTFTVTALVRYAGCLARNSATYGFAPKGSGSIACVAFLPSDSFQKVTFLGAVPVVAVRCEGVEGLSTFTDTYREKVEVAVQRLKEMGEEVTPARTQEVEDLIANVQGGLANVLDEESAVEAQPYLEVLDRFQLDFETYKLENWVVTTRAANGGVSMAQMLVDVLGRLRFSMASLFVIVGLLVCYSAIARIVNEQVVQIGTKKALGLFRSEVTISYLTYSLIAVVIGVVVGVAAAVLVVQGILNPAISGPFVLGVVPAYASLGDSLCTGVVELALILFATWLSCHGVLKRRAVDLLAGATPPTATERFYERWGIWKRMPLLYQTVVNNCVNDQRRVAGTIIGVAGCTALIVCALTLNNDVLNSYDRHYEDVYGFDTTATIASTSQGKAEALVSSVSDKGYTSTPVLRRTMGLLGSDGSAAAATLMVPQDATGFAELYHMCSTAGDEVDLQKRGAWVSAGYAKDSEAKVGDELTIVDSTGKEHVVPILGFYDFYLMNVDIVMGEDSYESAFGDAMVPNVLLVDSNGKGANQVKKDLKSVKGIGEVSDDMVRSAGMFNQFKKISMTVVLVYVGLAALMAFIVLLNLNVMYIDEKRRELIVLMICGFTVKQAKSYVRNDSIVLTILGILAGLLLGSTVGLASVTAIEPTNVLFLHELNLPACVIGAAVCAAFAAAVGYIALRRIPKLDLTDINRF